MPKYRFLTDDELKELEEEFKQFLIANGIHNEEWIDINQKDPDKAIDIAGLFSDLILDKVYDKTKYLIHQSEKSIKAFQFSNENAILLGVDYTGEKTIPLDNTLKFIKDNASNMLVYATTKKFASEKRNQEIHFLVKNGAVASDGKIFKFLKEVKKD